MSLVIAKWTIAEYHRMIEAGILSDRQVELLKGKIVEIPPEGEPCPVCGLIKLILLCNVTANSSICDRTTILHLLLSQQIY